MAEKALAAPFERLQPSVDPLATNQFTINGPKDTVTILFWGKDGASVPLALVTKIFDIITLIAGVLAVLYLIWSGIQYIISAGNAERIKSARSGIINAIIGIVIIVAAYAIVRFAISIANTINNAITA